MLQASGIDIKIVEDKINQRWLSPYTRSEKACFGVAFRGDVCHPNGGFSKVLWPKNHVLKQLNPN